MAIKVREIKDGISEIYVGGGNFFTQSYPTNFHQFYRQKMMTAGESTADWREVTAAQRAELEAADAKWERPSQSLIDRATAAGAVYNEETGFFELNGLTDISSAEMVIIDKESGTAFLRDYAFARSTSRTLYPIQSNQGSWSCDAKYAFAGCTNLECIKFLYPHYNGAAQGMFSRCDRLRRIDGCLIIATNVATLKTVLNDAPLLEEVSIHKLRYDLDISALAFINLASMAYMVEHATNTTAITVTVHADVMAKLIGDTTNAAAGALTEEVLEQWQALIEAAAERNITFITTT